MWNNSLKFCRIGAFSLDIAFRIYHEYMLVLQFDCKLEVNIVGDSGKWRKRGKWDFGKRVINVIPQRWLLLFVSCSVAWRLLCSSLNCSSKQIKFFNANNYVRRIINKRLLLVWKNGFVIAARNEWEEELNRLQTYFFVMNVDWRVAFIQSQSVYWFNGASSELFAGRVRCSNSIYLSRGSRQTSSFVSRWSHFESIVFRRRLASSSRGSRSKLLISIRLINNTVSDLTTLNTIDHGTKDDIVRVGIR